ncbi:MAG TPA: ATP-binding protein [Gemmatimonadaceae bacterium]|nr:ATP-binding protein [Gemmatimonadaceae bacterium]
MPTLGVDAPPGALPPPDPAEGLRHGFRGLFTNPAACAALLTPTGTTIESTPAAQTLLGLTPIPPESAPGAAAGTTTAVPPWLLESLDEVAGGRCVQREVQVQTDEGERLLAVELSPVRPDGYPLLAITMYAQDITKRHRNEREAALLVQLAMAVGQTDSVELAVEATLQQICQATGWALGEAWLPRVDQSGVRRLERRGAWSVRDHRLQTFLSQGAGFTFVAGEGIPGTAWVSRQPVWVHDLGHSSEFTRAPLAALGGLRAAVAVPLIAGDEVLAVLEFFLRTVTEQDVSCVALASAVATPLAVLLQRKQTEDAHRVAEAKLAGLISIAADAIISIDHARRITLFNWGAERIFGYRSDEMLGQSIDMLLPAALRSQHAEHIAAFGASQVTTRRMGERSKIVGQRKSGEVFPAEASISRFVTADEWTYTVILRDISERVRTEQGLRFLAEASAILADTLEDMAAVERVARLAIPVLGDLCVVDLVDAANNEIVIAALAAYDDTIETAIREFRRQTPLQWDVPMPAIQAMQTGDTLLVSDAQTMWTNVAPDGSAMDVRARLSLKLGINSLLIVPLRARGRVLGALTLSMAGSGRQYDESYRTLAEAFAARIALAVDNAALYHRVRQAVAAREQILGLVSHDLRNPLSAIALCLSGLQDDPPPDRDMMAGLVVTARESIDLMYRIIQDLLDVASIDAGRLSLRRLPSIIGPVLQHTIEMLRPVADDYGLSLALEANPVVDTLVANVDTERVAQVVSNLIGNACKFTARGGQIRVSTGTAGDAVCVAVQDTGCGIPAEALPHIFDRFWHAQQGAKQRSTGLGLAIARGIVEAHGGRIWAESTVGEGTTVFFTLPLDDGI